MEIRKAKISELKRGPIIHDTLSVDFIKRVKVFKKELEEVEKSSIESSLDNFKRDANPEAELILWEHMGKIYQWAIVANEGFDLPQKKEVFALILLLSMGQKDFSNIKRLSKEVIEEIIDRYQYE